MKSSLFWKGLLSIVLLGLPANTRLDSATLDSLPPADPLEDRPTLLVPKIARSETEQDRVIAASLFTHGRILLQQNDLSGALRKFQRAHRNDPNAVPILREIVPLAFQLKRADQAARYAVILAEKAPGEPVLLSQLAVHLSDQRDFARALELYEKALELQKENPPGASTVLLSMEMGRLYFLSEQFKKSAESFATVRQALENPKRYGINPKLRALILDQPHATYSLMAESFLEAGKYDGALSLFQKSNQAKRNDGLFAFHQARIEFRRGHYDLALEHLETYFEAKLLVAGVQPYQLLADILGKKTPTANQAQETLQNTLAELHKNQPSNAPLGYFLAMTYRQSGSLGKAEAIYLDLLKKQPALDGFQGLLEIYLQQQAAEKLLDILGQAMSQLLSFDPLGEPIKKIAKDSALVKKVIEQAQQKANSNDPELSWSHAYCAALLCLGENRFEVAEDMFQRALKSTQKKQKPDLLLGWGLELLLAERNARSAAVFQRAIDEKIAPENNAAFYFYLAGALELAKQTEQALEAAKKAVELSDNPQFKSREAWILYHAQRYEAAKESYLTIIRSLESDYTTPGIREVVRDARMILSTITVEQNDFEAAEEWLHQVLDEFPEDVGAENDLGYLWADRAIHLERALAMTTRATQAEPGNIAYRDSLGWVYFRLGKYELAASELEKATAGADPDSVILDHLGDVYLKMNKLDKAIAAWQEAGKGFKAMDDHKKQQAVEEKIKQYSK